jgi:hypothetical protein
MNCLFFGLHPASTVIIDLHTHYPVLSYCVSKYFVKFVGLLEWRTWAKILIIIIIIYIWPKLSTFLLFQVSGKAGFLAHCCE